jgi:CheY-like chemotaxis protein
MEKTNVRILVVEDESLVALDIKMRLVQLGYEVPSTLSTGEQAIAAAGELKPDLVLMDISLKGLMRGTEAAQKIHAAFDIPIIFLTAYADDKTLDEAKLAEPFGYLTKPLDEVELRVMLEIALYKAAAENERKQLTLRLQKALDEIKTLSGLIPICASCKKMRDDTGYWQAVEQYIGQRSNAQFTHGICPDCIKKLYPDLDLDEMKR